MSLILKPVFDVLTGDVAVCNNVFYNYLVLIVVGELAFRYAYSLVGDAYYSGAINGRAAGSILHWIIRLVLYILIAYFIRAGIWLNSFIETVPSWIWCFVPVLVITIYSVVTHRKGLDRQH